MIDMFMNVLQPIDPGEQLFPGFFFFVLGFIALITGQEFVQKTLVVIAIITIPWMLFPKPIILIYQHIKEERAKKKASLEYVPIEVHAARQLTTSFPAPDEVALLEGEGLSSSSDESLLNIGGAEIKHPEPDDDVEGA
jgi:hypothetical protein